MTKKRIIILGAGLAGLSSAWHLQRKGIDCQIFEKEPEVGGLCRSKNINGFTFDYDGHLLHFKHRYSFDLVKSLLGNNLARHKRSAWIYYQDRYIPYPFQANLHGLPLPVLKECLLGFIAARTGSRRENINFYDWIIQTFGKGIARHFMVPYNSKFWTLPLQELTCEWLGGFVPVPSLKELVGGTVADSQKAFGYNAIFWYPKNGGIGQLPFALASQVKNIFTGCQATGIDFKKKEIEISNGNKEKFDYLIYTIPLPELSRISKCLPKQLHSAINKLKWNSVFNLNLGIEGKPRHNKHWIYFPQQDISFFRVGFFNNFSRGLSPAGKQSLYIEVSYSKDKPIDKACILKSIIKDSNKAEILDKSNKVCTRDINDIKYGYPIYDKNYSPARNLIKDYCLENNVYLAGRYGSWRYMSMEDSLLNGKEIAFVLPR